MKRWRPSPEGLILFTCWAAVLYVFANGAIGSYQHIYELSIRLGQTGVAARLYPPSVDVLIVAGALVLLRESRAGRPADWLARLAVLLGIAATIAANALAVRGHGWGGAVWSSWSATFVIPAELLFRMIKRDREAADNAARRTKQDAARKRPARTAGRKLTGKELGAALGASERTGRRMLANGRHAA